MFRLLEELEIVGVWDRGTPNKERIAIRTRAEVNLGNYLLFLGIPTGDQSAIPLTADLFWFGNEIVATSTWVIIYTGPGKPKITKMQHSQEPALVLHWGKPITILNNTNVVPVIVSLEGVLVGPHPGYLRLPKGGGA